MCPIPQWVTQRPSSTVNRRCYCSTLASLWGEMGACNKDCSNYWSTTSRVLTESYCWGMVCMCVVHHPMGTLRAFVTRNLCSRGFVCPTTGVKKSMLSTCGSLSGTSDIWHLSRSDIWYVFLILCIRWFESHFSPHFHICFSVSWGQDNVSAVKS